MFNIIWIIFGVALGITWLYKEYFVNLDYVSDFGSLRHSLCLIEPLSRTPATLGLGLRPSVKINTSVIEIHLV